MAPGDGVVARLLDLFCMKESTEQWRKISSIGVVVEIGT